MAEDGGNDQDKGAGAEAPDLSFIPETFKGEDGAYKLDEFSTHFSELSQFKTAADERAAALPTEASAYALGVSEDHQFVEGFNPADHQVPVLNEQGEPVMNADGTPQTRDMTAADMINTDDPDLPALQEAMLKHQADPALMQEISSILVNRELRGIIEAGKAAEAETKLLGPEGPKRLGEIKQTVEGILPEAQAKAILDGITSADGLKAMESLIQKAKIPPSTSGNTGPDLDAMTNKELIALGMKQQMAGR